ncbi:VRR-NUC domain-containing protein [Geothermobacter ehrlichii]
MPKARCSDSTRRQNRRIENSIQKSILDWFAIRGVRCERLNSGALKAEERFIRFGFPGCPDLMVLDPVVRVGFIEVKAPGGRLSKDQRDFREHCRRSGIPHLVARSLEDVIDWWAGHEKGHQSRSDVG